MAKSRIVLADIAKAARVHISTVSLALRNSPKIAEETRRRIQQIAQELDYRPDPELQSLVAYRKSVQAPKTQASIAVVSDPYVTVGRSEYYDNVTIAILDYASAKGFNCARFIQGKDFNHSQQLDRILKARGIRGVIFHSIYSPETTFELDWPQYACLKINKLPEELNTDIVSSNTYTATKKATERILQHGFSRPALAICDVDDLHLDNRYTAGFLTVQEYIPAADRIPILRFPSLAVEDANTLVYNQLKDVKPDAIISNCFLAEASRKLTQDGQPCRFFSLEVETESISYGGMRSDTRQIGAKAVDVLIQKIQTFDFGLPTKASQILVDPIWVEPATSLQARKSS